MASDWIDIRLPSGKQLGRFILWGTGRLTFSSALFLLDGTTYTLQTITILLKWTKNALVNLVKVYDQLPYAGTYGQNIIDTTSVAVVEPTEIVTDLIQVLEGKHCLVIGDTGTGKSTIAQWIAYQVGGNVIVYDPDAAPDEWQGLEVIGRGGNFQAIADAMESDLRHLQERIQERAQSGDKVFAGRNKCYIAEEFPLLADEVEIAADWLLKHARRGRKPRCFVIALSQSDSVKALNIEGDGVIRNCFRYIRLGKFAVTHAKSLKDTAAVEWLKSGRYRCMVDDLPCQLPDLSQFKAVTQQLHLPSPKQPITTAETAVEPTLQPVPMADNRGSDYLEKAIKVCLELGVSDSKIIKEVLGYKGSQYQEGKILLERIKTSLLLNQT